MGDTVNETQKKSLFQRIGSWFKGLKAEFKRIIWPDRESLAKETVAVVFVSVLLGVIISALDFVIRVGIEFLVR